ncbi:MAG: lipoyl synthase [Actinomycetota bacterium]|nr:lipoyl synthase [Actinomycetota bacterium]
MTRCGARLRIRWLGRVPYREALDLQRAFWDGRSTGRTGDDYLLLLEHPHTYTVGRNGDGSNLKIAEDQLDSIGAELVFTDRGGDITYHGPGQLVGYPIVAVPSLADGWDAVGHLRRIEAMLIATLADLGIAAWAEEGFTGVWTDRGKIAAIGAKISSGVSTHGFSINATPDLGYFEHIVPCGIPNRPVTSLSEVIGRTVGMESVVEALIPRAVEVFGGTAEAQLGAFPNSDRSRPYDVDAMVAAGVFSPNRNGEAPITVQGLLPGEPEKPEWMRIRANLSTDGFRDLKKLMRGMELHTVCEEAGCPNIFECWESGTSTLMLLGETCTRACAFCDVNTGKPGPVDLDEAGRAAIAVEQMGLRHAVLTSVNRDDLPDGGAGMFADTIAAIRERMPDCEVEVLIPDFKGSSEDLETVMTAKPAVLNHNTETVLRLQRDIRTAANYARSLTLLARAKWMNPAGVVKSGLIVGMGETEDEVRGALADLRAVGVDIVTIGQYLRPTANHRPIDRYVEPGEFDRYAAEGERLGLPHVEAGPLVRSSYHAREALAAAR